MSNDLFVRLSKYAPSLERAPIENFFTELVREVLNQDSGACEDFLNLALRGKARCVRPCNAETQVSARFGIDILCFDLVVPLDKEQLIIENKVDASLEEPQISKYLEYVHKRGNARVLLASRDHNQIVEQARFRDDPQFVSPVLWGEVADCWEKKKQTYKSKCLVEGVLEFMEHYDMGPVRPFEAGEIDGAELGEVFHNKAKGMLTRLQSRLKEPAWVKDGRFQAHGLYPTGDGRGHKNYKSYKGLLWCSCAPASTPMDAVIWYFLGFTFGPQHQWLMRKAGQSECIAYVVVWRRENEKVRGSMAEEAKRLSTGLNAPTFQVDVSENGEGAFLFRRKLLKDFIKETDQAAAIINFLEQSHNELEAVVPRIYKHYRQGT